MLTLFHAPQSRSSRIVWLLEEIGVDYDIRYVDIFRSMTGTGGRDPDCGLRYSWRGSRIRFRFVVRHRRLSGEAITGGGLWDASTREKRFTVVCNSSPGASYTDNEPTTTRAPRSEEVG